MSFSFYTTIHKAIRSEIAEVCMLAGKTSFTDEKEVSEFQERFLLLLDFLRSHSEHEHTFIHPLLAKIKAAEFDELEDEHLILEKKLEKLEQDFNQIIGIQDEILSCERALGFYLALNQFNSDYLAHLHLEETKIMPLLNKEYSLDDFIQVMEQFKKSISPEQSKRSFMLMFKSINLCEILQLLSDIKKSSPDEVFMNISLLAKESVSKSMWKKIENRL